MQEEGVEAGEVNGDKAEKKVAFNEPEDVNDIDDIDLESFGKKKKKKKKREGLEDMDELKVKYDEFWTLPHFT